MVTKFDQRALQDNFITSLRRVTEDVNALKFRGNSSGGGIVVSSGGGLSVAIASVTTSNVTGIENTHHILNLAGLTGNRDFNLPTPTGIGSRCKITVKAGNNTYALIVRANGTEVARVFITNETLEYTSDGTGAGDWFLSQNNTIACLAVMERTTVQSITTSSLTQKVEFNSAPINVGGLADITTNYQATIRRDGNYDLGVYAAINNLDDGEQVQAHIYIDGALVDFDADFSPAANKQLVAQVIKKYPLTVGQTVRMHIFHDEGASQNTSATYKPQLWVQEITGAGSAASGGGGGGFSIGMIMMWAGSILSIPAQWQLCDGTNGTPDLQDRFIVGAGSTYSVDDTGGAASHDHDYSEVLEHTHPVSITDIGHNHTQNPHTHVQNPHQHGMAEGTTDGAGIYMDRSNAASAASAVTDNATATNQNETATNNSATTGITASTSNPAGSVATGTTETVSNLPPYYALAYIMYIG